MKKNGFTLVELLAVIAIIAILCLIVVPKIMSVITTNQVKLYKEQEVRLKEAAIKYIHDEEINSSISTLIITKEELIATGYIGEIYDIKDKTKICNGYVIISNLTTNAESNSYISCENYNSIENVYVSLIRNLQDGLLEQEFNESYIPNTTITLQNPTKTGYIFTGWSVSGTGASISGTTLTIGTSTTTITANWTINKVALIVNINNGSLSQTLEESYVPNTEITLQNPTRTGYIFTEWSVSGTGASISGTTLTIGTSTTTITANWTINKVALIVNINNGSLSQTLEESYVPNTEITLQNPTRTGYIFTGWSVSGTGAMLSGTTLTIGTEDTTITANWTADTTACTLQLSGTKSTVDTSWYVSDVTVTLTITGNGTVSQKGLATTSSSTNGKTTETHSTDTASVTYYGYVVTSSGKTASCNTTFKVDKTIPTCTITPPATATWIKNITVSGSDNVSLAASPYSWTSQTTGFSTTKTYTLSAKTETTFKAWVMDAAGNVGACQLKCGSWSLNNTISGGACSGSWDWGVVLYSNCVQWTSSSQCCTRTGYYRCGTKSGCYDDQRFRRTCTSATVSP